MSALAHPRLAAGPVIAGNKRTLGTAPRSLMAAQCRRRRHVAASSAAAAPAAAAAAVPRQLRLPSWLDAAHSMPDATSSAVPRVGATETTAPSAAADAAGAFDFSVYMRSRVAIIDSAMSAAVPALNPAAALPAQSPVLREAMRHSLLGGGKRIRSAMCLATCEMLGGEARWALPTAVAIEMINCHSLIIDDLPALDNDDFRRGLPTCHKVYGDAIATLAGSALLADAFLHISEATPPAVPPRHVLRASAELAAAAGSCGLQQGQAVDVLCEGAEAGEVGLDGLQYIHRHKTGAMVRAAVLCGAHLAGASAGQIARLRTYADCVGLVYQIMDDVFDSTAPAEELGKTPGKDAACGKATYAALAGVEPSVALADRLLATAKAQLAGFDPARAAPLAALADYVRRVGTKSPLRGGETGAGDLVFYPIAAAAGPGQAVVTATTAPKPSCR